MTVTSVPVIDKGLELLRGHASYELGHLNPDIGNAQTLSGLMSEVDKCVPRLTEIPSSEAVAVLRNKRAIRIEMKARGTVNE